MRPRKWSTRTRGRALSPTYPKAPTCKEGISKSESGSVIACGYDQHRYAAQGPVAQDTHPDLQEAQPGGYKGAQEARLGGARPAAVKTIAAAHADSVAEKVR